MISGLPISDMHVCVQSCLTLCDTVDSSLPDSSLHGKNTGVDCHSLLQGIFPNQGSNPGLLHCRRILYHLSHHMWLHHSFPFMIT